MGPGDFERSAYAPGTVADGGGHKVAHVDREEVATELASERVREQRLPGTGWPVQKHAIPGDSIGARTFGVTEHQAERVAQLGLHFIEASDVDELRKAFAGNDCQLALVRTVHDWAISARRRDR
jgi:hypothetical protein